MDPSTLVLVSEAILSLYPILIRTLPTTLMTQWFARFLVFPVLAYALSSTQEVPSLSSLLLRPSTLFGGLVNLVHIAASYVSFALLPAGTALSLFYTYPLWNLLAGWLFFDEGLSAQTLVLVAVAMIGVWLLTIDKATEKAQPVDKAQPVTPLRPPLTPPSPLAMNHTTGIAAAVLAALTETLLYVFVRKTAPLTASTPFRAILQLYPLGLLVLLGAIAYRPAELDLTPSTLLTLVGFNALVGFVGYATRFYTIPKVSTLTFSLLSFVGVVFGYLWGHLFTSDQTTPLSWLGSGLIVIAAFVARYQNDPRHG
jgi:drug/metabolite transporter (DMT)-like permease